ncbi:MAG: hypothetical protein V2A73_04000 [Pseudomonadota bacterium]
MADPTQPPSPTTSPPRVHLQLDDDVAQGMYSNLVLINHNQNEFGLVDAAVNEEEPVVH